MSKGALLLISIVMLPIGLLLKGYVLSVLWSWFIVTKFGLPPLAIAEALGLAIIVGYFTVDIAKTDWDDDRDEQKAARISILSLLKAVIFLGFGWIILQFT